MLKLYISDKHLDLILILDLSSDSLKAILYTLPNKALASLLTIVEVGKEMLSFSEPPLTLQECRHIHGKHLVEVQVDSRGIREGLLEKIGAVHEYFQKGLAELKKVGVEFITLEQYWDDKGEEFPPKITGSIPNSQFYESGASFESSSLETGVPLFTSQVAVVPTQEQETILAAIRSSDDGEILKAEAFAGTGKTTLCAFVAENIGNDKAVYLAFNKGMAEFGKNKLSKYNNVKCYTTDALAYKCVKPWDFLSEEKYNKEKSYNWSAIADRLGLPDRFSSMGRGTLVRFISTTVDNFCNSNDERISRAHIPPGTWSDGKEDQIIFWAEDLWSRIVHPNESIPIRPQHIMKIWDLRGGTIPSEFQFALFDEAQDANPAFMAILQRSDCKRLLIGDNHQQLYDWRGAKNSMQLLEGISHPLTQSFRFGPEIATYSNKILARKSVPPPYSILGNGGISSRIVPYSSSPPKCEWPVSAILCRTNAQVFEQAVSIAEKGHRLHVVGGMTDLRWRLLDSLKLFYGKHKDVTHPSIARFSTWDDLVVELEMTSDPELKRTVKIIEKNYETLDQKLNTVMEHHETDERRAPLVLSTTHKVKGREWEKVVLLDDFATLDRLNELPSVVADNEINILYVAATRAIRELYIPQTHLFS